MKKQKNAKKRVVKSKKVNTSTPIAVLQLTERGRRVKKFNSIYSASEATGVDSGSISKVVRGIREYAGGFKWQTA